MLYSSFHAFSYDILLKKCILNCPYSSGVLRRNTWLAGELAGRWRAGKLFIMQWLSQHTNNKKLLSCLSCLTTPTQMVHNIFEPSKGKWLPLDLRCLEGKVKQTWIIYITINNVRSDCLKNNMKTPPFSLHQQFLLALCTMSRLWCIPSTCPKRWRGKSFCSLSWYLRIIIHFIT